jgi:uncharacterized protein YjbI with pentapeptide repeats
MRNWDTADKLAFLTDAIVMLKNGGTLEPSTAGGMAPVDLRGMAFPTVMQCKQFELPSAVVVRVAGRQEFNDAKLRDVDLSNSRLDFSVWNHCQFKNVCFDASWLNQVRFFGCHFFDCSMRGTDLRDASFSVGRSGAETDIISTVFERADFRGASCSNPVIRNTSFLNCRLDGFAFDGALCDGVTFAGRYKELTFRGYPKDTERNRLRIDLLKADVMWINADFGVDLRNIILPEDGTCLIIEDRLRAVERLSSLLPSAAGKVGGLVATVLKGLFSDRAISPLDAAQDTFCLSKAMVADFAETNDPSVVDALFEQIRAIARSQGFLAA